MSQLNGEQRVLSLGISETRLNSIVDTIGRECICNLPFEKYLMKRKKEILKRGMLVIIKEANLNIYYKAIKGTQKNVEWEKIWLKLAVFLFKYYKNIIRKR